MFPRVTDPEEQQKYYENFKTKIRQKRHDLKHKVRTSLIP